MEDTAHIITLNPEFIERLAHLMQLAKESNGWDGKDINEFIFDGLTRWMQIVQREIELVYPMEQEQVVHLRELADLYLKYTKHSGVDMDPYEFQAFCDYSTIQILRQKLKSLSKEGLLSDEIWQAWLQDREKLFFQVTKRMRYPLEGFTESLTK